MSTSSAYPGLLVRGQKSSAVGIVQSILASHGLYRMRIDNDFGKHTEEALILFQQTHTDAKGKFLRVNATVDRDTWDALLRSSAADVSQIGSVVIPRGVTGDRLKFLKVIAGEFAKGVVESPKGSNWGGRVSVYLAGLSPLPWCAYFVSWAFHQAMRKWPHGARHGYVATWWNAAKKAGDTFTLADRAPEPGDLMVLLYRNEAGKLTGSGHIAVVTSVAPNGKTWACIGGNESDGVRYNNRNSSQSSLVGFIRLFKDNCKAERINVTIKNGVPIDSAVATR